MVSASHVVKIMSPYRPELSRFATAPSSPTSHVGVLSYDVNALLMQPPPVSSKSPHVTWRARKPM